MHMQAALPEVRLNNTTIDDHLAREPDEVCDKGRPHRQQGKFHSGSFFLSLLPNFLQTIPKCAYKGFSPSVNGVPPVHHPVT